MNEPLVIDVTLKLTVPMNEHIELFSKFKKAEASAASRLKAIGVVQEERDALRADLDRLGELSRQLLRASKELGRDADVWRDAYRMGERIIDSQNKDIDALQADVDRLNAELERADGVLDWEHENANHNYDRLKRDCDGWKLLAAIGWGAYFVGIGFLIFA